MKQREKNKLFKESLEKYGNEMQYLLLMEECAELSKECSKYIRGLINDKSNPTAVAEEIADVENMIEQLKWMLGDVWKVFIDLKKDEKLERLKTRLKEK